MTEYSNANQIKLLKKCFKVFTNVLKNDEKNNSLEKKLKNKKKFLNYFEEKFKKFNVNENERKIILNLIEKQFNFKNTKPIDITKKNIVKLN